MASYAKKEIYEGRKCGPRVRWGLKNDAYQKILGERVLWLSYWEKKLVIHHEYKKLKACGKLSL
jgi:hypothetical protein